LIVGNGNLIRPKGKTLWTEQRQEEIKQNNGGWRNKRQRGGERTSHKGGPDTKISSVQRDPSYDATIGEIVKSPANERLQTTIKKKKGKRRGFRDSTTKKKTQETLDQGSEKEIEGRFAKR